MKTIYMDVTNLIGFRGVTGIQRVVIGFATRLATREFGEGRFKLALLSHNRDFNFSICKTEAFMQRYLLPGYSDLNCVTGNVTTLDDLDSDAFWLDVDAVWSSLIPRHLLYPELKKRNIGIGVFVHDVIPFTHPQYVSNDSIVRFPS